MTDPEKKNAEIRFNRKRCKACAICVTFCPKQVFELDEKAKPQAARPEDCILCNMCVLRCPDFALEVEEVE